MQGRSPHASGRFQKCPRPRRHSSYLGRRAINPTLPKEVKAWGKAPWDRRILTRIACQGAPSLPLFLLQSHAPDRSPEQAPGFPAKSEEARASRWPLYLSKRPTNARIWHKAVFKVGPVAGPKPTRVRHGQKYLRPCRHSPFGAPGNKPPEGGISLGGWPPEAVVFVAASHQTRLDTRSKARRPIKVGIKGRGRSGRSRDSNPACLCCSSAHLVQCEPDEASSFTNPNVGPGTYASLRLKLDAWSSAGGNLQCRGTLGRTTQRLDGLPNATQELYLSYVPPTYEYGTRPFLRWVLSQGRSPTR